MDDISSWPQWLSPVIAINELNNTVNWAQIKKSPLLSTIVRNLLLKISEMKIMQVPHQVMSLQGSKAVSQGLGNMAVISNVDKLKHNLGIDNLSIHVNISLESMPEDLIYGKWALVQVIVMAWCHQALVGPVLTKISDAIWHQ